MTAQPSDNCRSPRRYRKAKQLRKGMAKSGHIFSFIMFSLIMKRNFYVTKKSLFHKGREGAVNPW